MTAQHLFDAAHAFPNADFQERYESLVGLDALKARLEKDAQALVRPDLFEQWSKQQHGTVVPAITTFLRRPPLLIFAGDVGTGKTELAMTIGDRVARLSKIDVELHCLSLRSRGTGAVGEMTALLSDAFRAFLHKCPKRAAGAKTKAAAVLLIDEADALAQSREFAQMHHEDRAGVNALIRGIDDLANSKAICMVIMCTNRLEALDPAIQRRAAAVFQFERPNEALVTDLLGKQLHGLSISAPEIQSLAATLSEKGQRGYGYTYSDITQRVIPSAILLAFPDQKLSSDIIAKTIRETLPTPPFKSGAA